MSDWGPVFVAVVLFVLLTPGLLIQIPGRSRIVEFGNFQTSGVSILIKNDEEEKKKQTIDNCVKQHGHHTGLHVKKIDGPMLSRKLEH
ncbi:UNVERIFIED_CONTAM: hypothetical protein Scaly_0027900 [Sesamum calycinum]|uniref:Uncharacterized protein n=1 Tax=Sesamum calycinum TaxID=2727403 RepID=A0AAW2ST84_9LAMI